MNDSKPPQVPEAAFHYCVVTKLKRVGCYANECPDKCLDVRMTGAEWLGWVARMEELRGNAP